MLTAGDMLATMSRVKNEVALKSIVKDHFVERHRATITYFILYRHC